MVKLGYPRVSCELRCGCPSGRGVDRKRVHSCVRCVPDCAAIEPGTGAERTGMDLRIWARSNYDAALLRRGIRTKSRRFCLRQRGSRCICRTVHRHTVRQMGATREEEAATSRHCANRVTPAIAVDDYGVWSSRMLDEASKRQAVRRERYPSGLHEHRARASDQSCRHAVVDTPSEPKDRVFGCCEHRPLQDMIEINKPSPVMIGDCDWPVAVDIRPKPEIANLLLV